MGAIWSMVPNRLLDEEAFLELSEGATCLLLQLYVLCDGYGLAPAGVNWLRRRTNCVDPKKALEELEGRQYVKRYKVGRESYVSLTSYEDHLPKQFTNKRGRPQYPVDPKGPLREPQGKTKGTPREPQGKQIDREHRKQNNRERGEGALRAPSEQTDSPLMHEDLT